MQQLPPRTVFNHRSNVQIKTFVLPSYVPTAMKTRLSFGVDYPFKVQAPLSCGCDQNGRCHIPHIKEKSPVLGGSVLGGGDEGRRTCGQREGEQVRQEVAGKVSFALVQRGGDLPADLLRHLGTHHGGDALGRLLAHLRERTPERVDM